MRLLLPFLLIGMSWAKESLADDVQEVDGDTSRKILGSSVVTSVSVVMETGNGTKTVFTDAVGKPQTKPHTASELASPIDLLNPDRYEFYTFDDNGDLVKRLMSLDEIKSIIATGDTDAFDFDTFSSNGILPEKRVTDIISNVQNVLKEEMETHKTPPNTKPIFDTPDVSDSWSMILPAIFGNSGEDIKPDKPIVHVTPETIMIEPNGIPSTTKKVISTLKPPVISTSKPTTTVKNKLSSLSYLSEKASPITTSNKLGHMSTKPTYSSTKSNLGTSTLKSSASTLAQKATTPRPSKSTTITSNTLDISSSARPTIDSSKIPLYKVTRVPPRPTFQFDYDMPLFKSTPETEGLLTSSSQYQLNSQKISSTLKPTTNPFNSVEIKLEPTTIESSTLTKMTAKPSTTTQRLKITSLAPTRFVTDQAKIPESTIQSLAATISSTSLLTKQSKIPESSTQSFTKPDLISSYSTKLPVTPTKYSGTLPTLASTFVDLVKTSLQQEQLNNLTTTKPVLSIIQMITKLNETMTSQNSSIQKPLIFNKNLTTITATTSIKPEVPFATNDTEIASTERTVGKENLTLTTTLNHHLSTWIPTSSTTPLVKKSTESVKEAITTTETSSESTGITIFTNVPNEKGTTFQDDQITSTTKFEPVTSTTNKNEEATLLSNQHLSATELLDQLLQSTNIYEINSELISPQKHTLDKIEPTTEKPSETTTLESVSITTEHDFISYPPTTDFTLLQSIEQILSQAASGVNAEVEPINTKKIQEILDNLSEQNISQVMENISSVASDLTAGAKLEDEMTLPFDQTTKVIEKVVEPTIINASRLSISNRKSDVLETDIDYEQVNKTLEDFVSTTETAEENEITSTNNNLNLEDNSKSSEIINITVISYENKKKLTQNINMEKQNGESNETSFIITTSAENTDEMIKTTTELDEDILTTTEKMFTTANSNSETTTLELTTEEPSSTSAIFIEQTMEKEILEKLDFSSTEKSTTNKTSTTVRPTTPKITNFKKPLITITVNNGTVATEKISLFRSTTTSSPAETKPLKQDSTTAASTQNIKHERSTTETPKLSTTANILEEGNWTLVSTMAPHDNKTVSQKEDLLPPIIPYPEIIDPPEPINLVPQPIAGFGLEDSTSFLDTDIYQFTQLCNELAFGFWKMIAADLSIARSVFLSPFAATSMLAMVFLGARGATSGEMNEILKLDDMVTFNPHLTFKNVSESVMNEKDSDVSISIMARELFSDKEKGKLLDFYKNRVRAFYDGYVEEVSFKEIGDVIRRRTNLLVKKFSNGRIPEFLRDSSITARSPLAGISANVFQTDCTHTSMEGRDGELHFVVSPSIRQRRLIPIPAVVYKSGFLAGYETSLDATAVAIGTKDQIVSTIFVIPGQQGFPSQADSLVRLEKRLVESSFKKGAWSRLLRSLIPRTGLEVQLPKFAHRSIINATTSLQKMGLHELFNAETADLRGLNGIANELYLSDVLQINSFATCGERTLDSHHLEVYPTSANPSKRRSARVLLDLPDNSSEPDLTGFQRAFTGSVNNPKVLSLPYLQRLREARLPEAPPRLKFDRPFLYFVRHNPTGLILHMGRFNPRLLP